MATWLGGLELTLGAVAISMAIMVLAAGRRLRTNQVLFLVLMVDGLGWFGIADAMADLWPASAGIANLVVRISLAASPWLYAVFVAETLDVPSTQWARTRTVRSVFMGLAVLAPLLLITVLDQSAWYQRINSYVGIISGPHVAIATWALVGAWQYLQASEVPRQASAYFIAFALRDLALVSLFGAALVAKQMPAVASSFSVVLLFVKLLLLQHLLYLIYAVLSGQVLGLDDQVRATIQKGIVLVVVSGVFLVLTEGTEMIVGVDSPVLAILAAGVITLVFQPVQAGAQRLAERLLPGDAVDPRMSRRQRIEMYRKQVEIALMDGVIGRKEETMLARLREELGVPEDEARRVEQSIRP